MTAGATRNGRSRSGFDLRRLVGDGIRYSMAGCLAAGVDYAIFILLVHGAAFTPPMAQAVSRAMGGGVGFLAHRFWTFRYKAGSALLRPLCRFWIVWAFTYLLAVGAVALFAHALPDWPLVAKVLADGVVAAVTFFLQRHWTFRAG